MAGAIRVRRSSHLALPIYEIFERRGPALNLFALIVNAAAAAAIVLSARQLLGTVFAFAVAALLAVFGLVRLPFLLANEWNPILPILPLALLCFLTVRLSLGALQTLPGFAFVASAIAQTHVGYAPAVIGLCVFAWVNHRRRTRGQLFEPGVGYDNAMDRARDHRGDGGVLGTAPHRGRCQPAGEHHETGWILHAEDLDVPSLVCGADDRRRTDGSRFSRLPGAGATRC